MRTRTLVILLFVVAALHAVVPSASAGAAGKGSAAETRSSSGCGRKAAPRATTHHVTVDGSVREYVLSVPRGYDPSKPAPLLFNFHGLSSNMMEQGAYTEFDRRGGARGYVVITPNGQPGVLRYWALAASANPDVEFVAAMLRAANRTLCIDQARVYATGISNGGMLATVLACALPGRFAAIAPIAGVNATPVCGAGTPRISVLAFHGTADPINPYMGGDYFGGSPLALVLGVPPARPVDDATAEWAAFDGCRTPPKQQQIGGDVQHFVWPGCAAGRAVELYRVVGGGHTWPGAKHVQAEILGETTSSIDATKLILDFFDRHPRPR